MASITNHEYLLPSEVRCRERLPEIGGWIFGIICPYPRTVFVMGTIDFIRFPFQMILVWFSNLLFAQCAVVYFHFIDDAIEIGCIWRPSTDVDACVSRSYRRSDCRVCGDQFSVYEEFDSLIRVEITGHCNVIPLTWRRAAWGNCGTLSAFGIPDTSEESASLNPDAEIKAFGSGKNQIGVNIVSR